MALIQESKKDFEKKELAVLEKARGSITEIINQFSKNEKKIGEELASANVLLNQQRREENKLLPCVVCKKGTLIINYSKKNRKHFVACNAYPDCKTTYSLPEGLIKKSGKICEKCDFPMLLRIKYGRRPWEFCFNPLCEKNRERIEEYNKKKNKEEEK